MNWTATSIDVFSEAQALGQLNHPSIIRLSTCGYADAGGTSRPYLVMDYFDGVNLESYVDRQGSLLPEDLLGSPFRWLRPCKPPTHEEFFTGTSNQQISWLNERVRVGG